MPKGKRYKKRIIPLDLCNKIRHPACLVKIPAEKFHLRCKWPYWVTGVIENTGS